MKKPFIVVRNLTHKYHDIVALENISFDIPQGSITAIIGPNGSGKSTLIRIMIGLLSPTQGSVLIQNQAPHTMRQHIGYVPQHFQFDRTLPITVEEFLKLYKCKTHAHHTKHIYETLSEVGVEKSAKKILGTLSGGEFQRVLIARAILHEKKLLVLDEPSSGIDVEGEHTFYELIKRINKTHGTTCVIISHDISMVHTFADTVICINKEKICQGIPHKTITPEVLTALYGTQTGIYHHQHTKQKRKK